MNNENKIFSGNAKRRILRRIKDNDRLVKLICAIK